MCDLCDQWRAKEITAEQAMEQMREAFKTADSKTTDHLIGLAAKILDEEVPLEETNSEADQKWWKAHHPKKNENSPVSRPSSFHPLYACGNL